MGWWVLTYLHNDRQLHSLLVLCNTNHPAHLMMAWSIHQPARTPIYRWVRGKRVFCGFKYIWNTPNLTEQTQTGETFTHLFPLLQLDPLDHVWYLLSSTKTLYTRYCQSALIHVPPPELPMPAARIFHSVDQPCLSDVYTTLVFDSVLYDDYGFWDPGDPTKLTILAGALYSVGASLRLVTGAGMSVSFQIRDNNGNAIIHHDHSTVVPAFAGGRISLHTINAFHPGDFLECRLYHTAGIPRDVVAVSDSSPHFWIAQIGPYPVS